MTLLSVRLSRAVSRGRADQAPPVDRAALLRALLHKRAAAHNANARELEEMLRSQIRWSLPIERAVERSDP